MYGQVTHVSNNQDISAGNHHLFNYMDISCEVQPMKADEVNIAVAWAR